MYHLERIGSVFNIYKTLQDALIEHSRSKHHKKVRNVTQHQLCWFKHLLSGIAEEHIATQHFLWYAASLLR